MPNPLGCIIGFLLTLIPGFKSFFYDKNSAVYCFADTGLAINLAGLVIGQMLLGSNLLLFYGRKSLMTKKIMIMIIFTKNAVIPGITFVLTLFF